MERKPRYMTQKDLAKRIKDRDERSKKWSRNGAERDLDRVGINEISVIKHTGWKQNCNPGTVFDVMIWDNVPVGRIIQCGTTFTTSYGEKRFKTLDAAVKFCYANAMASSRRIWGRGMKLKHN